MRTHFTELSLDDEAWLSLAHLMEHPIVNRLAMAFAGAGAQLYLVGGPVRGALMGIDDHADLDFTTDLRPEQMRPVLATLGTVWEAGAAFGTLGVSVKDGHGKLHRVEVTTFRTEVYAPGSRKPTVGFGDRLEDDLLRRDLTVNALALDVRSGELIDLFDGIGALSRRELDTPDDPVRTFTEDPLRILRVVRFAAKLQATPSQRVVEAIEATRGRLGIVSPERKLAELDKMSTSMEILLDGLRHAYDLGVLDQFVPGVLDGDVAVLLRPADVLANADEAIAALLNAKTDAEAEASLRAMTMPVTRIKNVCTLVRLARTLRETSSDDTRARSILREYADPVIDAAARINLVCNHPTGLATRIFILRCNEPDVRAGVPVTGAELAERGMAGMVIREALGLQEEYLRCHGTLTREQALHLLGLSEVEPVLG